MANPSTSGPSVAGTEVLRRAYKVNLSNSTYVIIPGASVDHIYTILSVIFHNKHASTAATIGLQISAEAVTAIHLMKNTSLPAQGTFVFSDKIVIAGTDELVVRNETANIEVDVYVSYIDQYFA